MNIRQEITVNQNIPFKIFLHQLRSVSTHCHDSYELLFVLSGTASATIEETTYMLEEEDMILVNPNQLHNLHSGDCVMVVLQMKPSLFEKELSGSQLPYFEFNSSKEHDKSKFHNTKVLIAKLIKSNTQEGQNIHLITKALLFELMYELTSQFHSSPLPKNAITKKHVNRISDILTYINENYSEDITLAKLSKEQFLSVSYLSRYIEKELGQSFKTHLTNVRLNHAFNDLCTTNNTISTIASTNGFPNTRAFVSAFKKKYECLPSTYRKDHNLPVTYNEEPKTQPIEFQKMTQNNYLGKLSKYLDDEIHVHSESIMDMEVTSIPEIDVRKSKKRLFHTFRHMIAIGSASNVLEKKTQDMLTQLQQDIHFKHVQLHGFFGNDVIRYFEERNTPSDFNFDVADDAIDFLLSIGLKPTIQLGFEYNDIRMISSFLRQSANMKKLLGKWQYIVERFLRHLMIRYGLEEVSTWLFMLQEEIDEDPLVINRAQEERYWQLYLTTFRVVRKISDRIQFGPSSALPYMIENTDLLESLLAFFTKNDCIPDFFTFKFYPISFFEEDGTTQKEVLLSPDPERLGKFIDIFKERLSANMMTHLPLYMTQWNSTIANNDLLNDTCFKSTYIVKNVIDNIDRIDSFGYWLLSDHNNIHQPGNELFHGGLGLFTKNGIKKAAYNAFWLLSKLGAHILSKGDGYLISRTDHDLQIILYNYHHYSKLYAMGELYDLTPLNRYTPFTSAHSHNFEVSLNRMHNADYIIQEYTVNQHYGSSFDTWVQCFAMPLTTNEELNLLKAHAEPLLKKQMLRVDDQSLKLSYTLEPHEVKLITITYTDYNQD